MYHSSSQDSMINNSTNVNSYQSSPVNKQNNGGINNNKNKIYEAQFNKASNTPDLIGNNSKIKNQGSKGKFEDLLKRNQNNSAMNIHQNSNPNDIVRSKTKNIDINNS